MADNIRYMAHEPENPHGGMLFTDFDVSPKGRPAAPLHSITELAGTLELDFEDDDGMPAPAPEAWKAPEAPKTPEPAQPPPLPDVPEPQAGTPENRAADDDFSFGSGLTLPAWPAPAPASAPSAFSAPSPAAPVFRSPALPAASQPAPTWDEYANAFRARSTRVFTKPGEKMEAFPPLPSAASIFTAFRSAADRPVESSSPANAPTAAYMPVSEDDPDLDDGFDILSAIPSTLVPDDENPYEPPFESGEAGESGEPGSGTKTARKPRPVLRAPDIPYGGLTRIEDWYAPPENQPEKPLIPTDWYEPPEEIAEFGGAGSAAGISDFLNSDVFSTGAVAGDSLHKSARLIPEKKRHAASDTIVDLFSNLDIDGEWDSRVSSAPSRPAASDTAIIGRDAGSIDLFSDVDLETAWEERQASRRAPSSSSPDAGQDARRNDAKVRSAMQDTVIIDGATLGKSGFDVSKKATQIIPKGAPAPAPKAAPKSASASQTAPKDTPKGAAEPVMEFLDDDPVEDEEPAAGTAEADSSSGEPAARGAVKRVTKTGTAVSAASAPPSGPRTAAGAKPSAPSEHDYLDVMDELDDAGVRGDVAAPEIDDSALETEAQRKQRKSRRGAAGAVIPSIPGDIDVEFGESGAAESGDGGESGTAESGGVTTEAENQAADAIFDLDEDAHKNRETLAAEPLRTTEDLLQDIDFDDLGINEAVSAPVIDDSAIDEALSGPKPGTEEMRAIADGDFGEDESGSEPEAAAAVPVNPADVFANMDDMDFSDDMDDDMKAMLDESVAEIENEGAGVAVEGMDGSMLDRQSAALPEAPPKGFIGKLRHHARKLAGKVMPFAFFRRLGQMIGWSENWWFYCDIVAAIIASASLAVIISYYFWYAK